MQNRSRSRSNDRDQNRPNDTPAEPSKRLFISGILPTTTQQQLEGLFNQCGSVKDILLKPLENGGVLCFVEMNTQQEADKAIADLNGKRVCGKMIWVKYAYPRPGGNRREGGGGRQGDQDAGQRFGQRGGRGGRGGFNPRGDGFRRFEGGRGNDRSNQRSNERSNEGRSVERGRFGQQDQGSTRGGFRNFDKREEDRGSRMFGGNGGSGFQGENNRGGREQGPREQGGREQNGGRQLNVVEDMEY